MDYKTIGITLLVISVAISTFLEWIKIMSKKKDKNLPTWAQITIPAILSIALSWVAWSAFELAGKQQAVIIYSLIVFLAQYYLSMEVLKRVGKPVAKFFMRSQGMNKEEIAEVFKDK